MVRKNRTPGENARREKIRELLQMTNTGNMDDIQDLFKEAISEFMENTVTKREKLSKSRTVIRKLSFPLGATPPILCLWRCNFCAAGKVIFIDYSGTKCVTLR